MKAARVKSLFAKYLQQDMPQFVVDRGIIYEPPIDYLLRGFVFESSVYGADYAFPTVFVIPLFVPEPYIYFTFGKRLCSVTISADMEAEAMDEVRRRMIREGLPLIDRLRSISLFVRNASRIAQGNDSNIREAIAYATILDGDVARGRRMAFDLSKAIRRNKRRTAEFSWLLDVATRLDSVVQACDESPIAARALLDQWTSETKLALKLPT